MKRKYKKSLLMPLILFVYTTVMAIYFLPRNTEVGVAEKWLTLAAGTCSARKSSWRTNAAGSWRT